MREAAAGFSASPSAAAHARHFAAAVVRGWGLPDTVDTLELLVSELVTNAVRHAGTPGEVHIAELVDRVRVDVTDASPIAPTQPHIDLTETSGRGLLLVRELSDAWGIDLRNHGKAVWFELTT
jgi:anti-sigma regulatory factor (Ser/Thr protein kinase)